MGARGVQLNWKWWRFYERRCGYTDNDERRGVLKSEN